MVILVSPNGRSDPASSRSQSSSSCSRILGMHPRLNVQALAATVGSARISVLSFVGPRRGTYLRRSARLAFAAFLATLPLATQPLTSQAQAGEPKPTYDVKYDGTLQLEWTPDVINQATSSAPPDVVGYGHGRIQFRWTAEGIGDVSDPEFRLPILALDGTAHLDDLNSPVNTRRPPLVCDGNLSQVIGGALRVRLFPAAQYPSLSLADVASVTGERFQSLADEIVSSDGDSLAPDFPLDQYVQNDNRKPECQVSVNYADWIMSELLPNYPADDLRSWVRAELAPTGFGSGSTLAIFGYDYTGPSGGRFASIGSTTSVPNAFYSVSIHSTLVIAQVESPGG